MSQNAVQLLMPTLLRPSPPWLPLSLIDTLPPSGEKWWPSVIPDSLRQLNLQTLPSTNLREKRERENSMAGGAVWRIHSYSWFWLSALAAFLFVPVMVYVPLFLFFLCFVLFFCEAPPTTTVGFWGDFLASSACRSASYFSGHVRTSGYEL